MTPKELGAIANRIRRRDLQAVFEAGAGHIGGEMSVTDLLTALYFHTMNVNSEAPEDPGRDRLVLSKGHTALALYITLAERGFFPKEEISTFLQHRSRLNGHPNRVKVPGVETNTGPLGHGLPVAVGMAKAAQLDGATWRTFVITGDGEMQEGSNWEAIMAVAQFNNLAPLTPKLEAFGWAVEEIDGHDMEQICRALSPETVTAGQPKCVVAHTNKGQGISFMSDNVAWHHKVPSEDQYKQAMAELEEAAQ